MTERAVPVLGLGRTTLERFLRHRLAMVASGVLALTVVAFFVLPLVSPYASNELGELELQNAAPSWRHPFGNDGLGRDLMVRTFEAGRYSIRIAVVVSLLTTIIGTLIGTVGGYLGGWVDAWLNQLTNLVLIVPALVVLMVLSGRFGASPNGIAVVLALLLWPSIARVARGVVLQVREQEFVLAARAAGARVPRILLHHVIPNSIGPVVVHATLLVSIAIILESTLSFLALGVQPPTPTLGNLVADARDAIDTHPHRMLFPAGFIVLISLCVNFVGDGLRDAFDPDRSV